VNVINGKALNLKYERKIFLFMPKININGNKTFKAFLNVYLQFGFSFVNKWLS